MITSEFLLKSINKYLQCTHIEGAGRYKSSIDGKETLYASCFALMIMHFIGKLSEVPEKEKAEWAEYILSHQDPDTGYFVGPEISLGKLLSEAHSRGHLSMHLTAHVLPALKILGIKPEYSLKFAEKYLDIEYLDGWLCGIDWTSPWLEGNNLLFVGQFLIYLFEEYNIAEAKPAVDYLLNWLDTKIDSTTGLWGTEGCADIAPAIYGAYHQLILYYYLNHNIKYREKLIDSVLSIQHIDGGFSDYFGGGSCEDVDCVDILVNMYKITKYKHNKIETALRKSACNLIRKLTSEGGFYYKRNTEFYHMGMEYTYAPPQRANMFSTWFTVHTLFLISEVIDLPCTRSIDYNFNQACSMGWHIKSGSNKARFYWNDLPRVIASAILYKLYFWAVDIKDNCRSINRIYNLIRGRHA
ncbi:hypothetical protein F6V25_03460 [Oryzomonas japonica]|uniref:Prenyltransferase alpha-alpha toroid domain-containing protein n=1 Tax=Oryzomonas japonica TaxID=2603858 RepID=A0A7J4ZSR9_9BACT|nr:hypothetical protein [Oryzomonas japonica]KAB0666490.1 hypothetical protein F6V25_03460 [Oryzomonas japonica]